MSEKTIPKTLPGWLEKAFGDPMSEPEPWQKALTVATPCVPVYARWLPCMTRMCDELIPANQWVVWWTNMTPPMFEEFSREEFDERFVLESQAPDHMRERFAEMPNYLDWVAMHNADEEARQ